jgi:hypothetical protein
MSLVLRLPWKGWVEGRRALLKALIMEVCLERISIEARFRRTPAFPLQPCRTEVRREAGAPMQLRSEGAAVFALYDGLWRKYRGRTPDQSDRRIPRRDVGHVDADDPVS